VAVRASTAAIAAAALAVAALVVYRVTQPEPPAAAVAEPNLFPFVRSFEGTRPDGAIEAAAAAQQVASEELVRLFDYYLSAVGERSIDDIRTAIERELAQRLPPPAAAHAAGLLGRYLDYKRALVEVEQRAQNIGNAPQAIRARLADMRMTRRRFFGDAEIRAMFATQDAWDEDAVARLEIGQDASLSEQQKRDRLAALDAALPPALREAREEPFRISRLQEQAQAMRAQGASDDDIYRMRAAALTPEAAARMAEADEEDQRWQTRIDAYLAERRALLAARAGLPAAQRQAALAQLRQSRFTPEERLRLPAYEPAEPD
jgi:lipase chaperone LimK